MKKFPSIEQFRHAVRAERDQASFEGRAPSVRKYRGTVKLHGTNAGVTWPAGKDLIFQSRSRIIKVGDDNAGFAAFYSDPKNQHWLKLAIAEIASDNGLEPGTEISVFGEWCGEGIQKGVAITQLPKMFVIFAAHAENRWLDVSQLSASYADARVFGIHQFPTFEIEIDFIAPELAQNQMVAITEAVEAECPVGAFFGVQGIGEGVVWSPVTGDHSSTAETLSGDRNRDSSRFWFKVKGEKHSSSKVAKLASVDVEAIRKKDELVASLVTENRLNQAADIHSNENKLSFEIHNIGSFLRWVFNDIQKEETDTIEASGFQVKELGKPVSDVAKRFYLIRMAEEERKLMADLTAIAA